MAADRWLAEHRLVTLALIAFVPGGLVLWMLLPWLARRR